MTEPDAPDDPLPASLRRTLRAGRVSSAYLFEGPDPERLREAAVAFAAALLCPEGGCGACRACRLVTSGRHPDLHVLEKDKATVISVAALAPVLEEAHRTPVEAARQVFVIDPAEALEPEGVARYLKSLEEPPKGTVFVLVSARPDRLPETVLSRCRRVRFPPDSSEAIASRLLAAGAGEEEARVLARASSGSLARARRLRRTGLREIVRSLVEAARDPAPRVADATDRALKAIEAAAAEEAPAEAGGEEGGRETKGEGRREGVRTLLQDAIHLLAVEARERAGGRPSDLLPGVAPRDALALLERWGSLSAAVASNVTPAAILLDWVVSLRAPSPRV